VKINIHLNMNMNMNMNINMNMSIDVNMNMNSCMNIMININRNLTINLNIPALRHLAWRGRARVTWCKCSKVSSQSFDIVNSVSLHILYSTLSIPDG